MLFLYFATLAAAFILAIPMLYLKGQMEAHLVWDGSTCTLDINIVRPLGKASIHLKLEGPDWTEQSFITTSRQQFPLPAHISKHALFKDIFGHPLFTGSIKIHLDKLMTGYDRIRFFLRFLIMEKIEWKTVAGGDDAMKTALASGAIWALKGLLISGISFQGHIRDLDILVQPNFYHEILESRVNCIFKMRIVHIIFVEAYILIKKARGRI